MGLREFANGWVQTTDALRASLRASCLVFFWIIFQNMKKISQQEKLVYTVLPAFGVYRTTLLWLLRLCHLANEGLHWPRLSQYTRKEDKGTTFGFESESHTEYTNPGR